MHVAEHSLQLRRELIAALALELGDEAALQVVRDGAPAEQALGQRLPVVRLKHVLAVQEPKQGDDLQRQRGAGAG